MFRLLEKTHKKAGTDLQFRQSPSTVQSSTSTALKTNRLFLYDDFPVY